jgi:predicted Fe-Mo cluster-binding NifX family protein
MKICVPATNDQGLDARVSDHFGSAPFFALADTMCDQVEMIANAGRDHHHGQCHPVEAIRHRGVDAVVCPGMGRRALATLRFAGLDVYRAPGKTVREILADARDGRLDPLMDDHACGGGGHGSCA